jgi:hypothetical protein
MTGYNLPDGVNTSDLPGWGFEPEDVEDEDTRDFDPDYADEDEWEDEPYFPELED